MKFYFYYRNMVSTKNIIFDLKKWMSLNDDNYKNQSTCIQMVLVEVKVLDSIMTN